jgi:hypothetical protein
MMTLVSQMMPPVASSGPAVFPSVPYQADDQAGDRPRVGQAEEGGHGEAKHPERARFPVDVTRVDHDQDDQQHAL